MRTRRAAPRPGVFSLVIACLLVVAGPAAATALETQGDFPPDGRIRISGLRIAMRSWRTASLRAVVDSITVESTASARFVLWHRENRTWVERRRLGVSIVSQTPTRTVLAAAFRPPSRGRWRVRLQVDSTESTATTLSPAAYSAVVGPRWVALTFDGGPWPTHTRGMLRVLRSRDVKATFFLVGAHLRRNPSIARTIAPAGHQIGNHTMNHPDLTRCSSTRIRRELSSTNRLIRSVTGVQPTVFRPPCGTTNSRVVRVAGRLGLRQVLWTADSADWLYPSPSAIRRRVLSRTRSGGIILMHDGGGNRSTTVRALPGIIDTLKGRGYHFVTMAEWRVLRDTR